MLCYEFFTLHKKVLKKFADSVLLCTKVWRSDEHYDILRKKSHILRTVALDVKDVMVTKKQTKNENIKLHKR